MLWFDDQCNNFHSVLIWKQRQRPDHSPRLLPYSVIIFYFSPLLFMLSGFCSDQFTWFDLMIIITVKLTSVALISALFVEWNRWFLFIKSIAYSSMKIRMGPNSSYAQCTPAPSRLLHSYNNHKLKHRNSMTTTIQSCVLFFEIFDLNFISFFLFSFLNVVNVSPIYLLVLLSK